MRRWLAVVLALLLMAATAAMAGGAGEGAAERRVALVIGNGTYANVPQLANPGHDSTALADGLRRIGFDVVELRQNLDRPALTRALQDFARQARMAAVAVVFYAGHGLELGGRNFLIPTDARLATDTDVDFEAVPLDLVLSAVQGASRFRLVMLDACRDNPFVSQMQVTEGQGRSVGRGLAPVEPPTDTLVAYAARDGQVAADGTGPNSPFTAALLQNLASPGLEIQFLFRKVRDEVLASTGNAQEPHVYGSLGSEPFYLVPPPPQPAPTAAPPIATAPPAAPGPEELELAFWRSIEDSRTASDFEAYLRRFPQGVFTDLARSRLERLAAPATPAAPAPTAQKPAKEPDDVQAATAAIARARQPAINCARLLQKAQLGEILTDDEHDQLQRNCGS